MVNREEACVAQSTAWHHHVRQILIMLLKIGLSVAIIAYLVMDARKDPETFKKLVHDPKNWSILLAALAVCAAAVSSTIIRWWYLVRALGVPFPFRDALRIGFVGYLFNLAPMGIVGGDLLKAWMLAREQRGHEAKAVAAVAMDRIVGLQMLFVVVSAAILVLGYHHSSNADIRGVANFTLLVTAVSTAVCGLLLTPTFTDGRLTQSMTRLPRVGRPIGKLIDAVRLYRQQPAVLINSIWMSVMIHALFSTGIYLIARGLPDRFLTLGQHFFVAPLSAVATLIPLPAGPQEGAIQYLYGQLLDAPAKGLAVGLSYRLVTVLIALIGVVYYLGSRREVAEVIHEVEEGHEEF